MRGASRPRVAHGVGVDPPASQARAAPTVAVGGEGWIALAGWLPQQAPARNWNGSCPDLPRPWDSSCGSVEQQRLDDQREVIRTLA